MELAEIFWVNSENAHMKILGIIIIYQNHH